MLCIVVVVLFVTKCLVMCRIRRRQTPASRSFKELYDVSVCDNYSMLRLGIY